MSHNEQTIAQLIHNEIKLKEQMQRAEQLHAEAVEALQDEHEQDVNDKVREALGQRETEHAQEVQDMYEERQLVIDDVKQLEGEIARFKHDAEQREAGLKHDHLAALRRKDQMVDEAWALVRSQTADRNRSVHWRQSKLFSLLA